MKSGRVLAPIRPPFERGEFTQTLIDVAAALFLFLFGTLFGIAIVAAIGILWLL